MLLINSPFEITLSALPITNRILSHVILDQPKHSQLISFMHKWLFNYNCYLNIVLQFCTDVEIN